MPMDGMLYTIDENNLIVAEREIDFNDAVYNYMGKKDSKGRRYIVSVKGAEVPYKYKPRKFTALLQSDKSKDSTDHTESG